MVKNKLWRFGDSYSCTQEDRFGHIEQNHSLYIAEHFNLDLIHLGEGGFSNLEIVNKILSNGANYKKGDMILINFASPWRLAILENNEILKRDDGDNTFEGSNVIKTIVLNDLVIPISDIIFYLITPFLESLIKNGIKVYYFYNEFVVNEVPINITKKNLLDKNELEFNFKEHRGFINWVRNTGRENLSPSGNLHYVVGKQKEIAEEIINRIKSKNKIQ